MRTFEGKNILVTGSTGLIGSNLVDRLMGMSPAKMIVTGRNIGKLESTFAEYISRSDFEIVQHDAAEPLPTTIKDIDFIFHAAGPMERDIVMKRPVDVVLPNILGTVNMLRFLQNQDRAAGRKGRMIVFSSVTVYNNPGIDDYDALEDDTAHAIPLDVPTACYAESKRMSEVIARSYVKQYGVDAVIARFSTVYGPTKNIPDTAFYEFIRKSVAGEDIVINSPAAPRRDNIYVDDAIDGLMCIALLGEIGEAYNISSGGDLGNYAAIDEIARMAASVAGKGSQVNYKMNEGMKKGGMTLNNSKLKSLGWTPRYSLEQRIAETIKIFAEHR
jgi:nucleoside-diphosphate-sugar epimerase